MFTQTELDFEMNRAERASRIEPLPPEWRATGWDYWDMGEGIPTGFCLPLTDETGGMLIMGTDANEDPDGDAWTPPGPGPKKAGVRLDYMTDTGSGDGRDFPDRDSARSAAELIRSVLRWEQRGG